MVKRASHQQLPSNGPEREALREKGQFWTPSWVAEAMVAYTLQDGADHLFDPAVGAGAFFRAARVVGSQFGQRIALYGTEVDPQALEQAAQSGLTAEDLASVEIRNFVLQPPDRLFRAIAANPPYIRHHRLPITLKTELKSYSARVIGKPLDGRAGLHIYFLLRALQLLDNGGRLAFIMPADTCEGKFASILWAWITRNYRLDAVVTFSPDATPFPGVDTNAVVLMICRAAPAQGLRWARCIQAETAEFRAWTLSGFEATPSSGMMIYERPLQEALKTGLSRPVATTNGVNGALDGPTLADFATVMRGIATGANQFFFLTKEQARQRGIPDEFLQSAIGRTRDAPGTEVTMATLNQLDAAGRPTRLLALDGRSIDSFPHEVRDYLRYGEEMGLPGKPLISLRRPWYKMETRPIPPFLFAYLGRRNSRFIRNSASVLPLTNFLCIYPRRNSPEFAEQLWRILQHPATIANLSRVGKSYGDGAIKVEPRALERLPIPEVALEGMEIGWHASARFEQGVLLRL